MKRLLSTLLLLLITLSILCGCSILESGTPCEHIWDNGSVTKSPTCTSEGTLTYKCTLDPSHTKTEPIDINPSAHTWDDGKVTKTPTQTEPGTLTYTCIHNSSHTRAEEIPAGKIEFSLESIPAFNGKDAFVKVNAGVPFFTDAELLDVRSYESYAELDSLSRCGVAISCIGFDLMPTEPRGSIGQVKPSGWHTVKYDIVDGKYLYNRCHLIGFQLTGENANTKNLITGTRYMNVTGMLPFENMIADYLKEETENHVLYRVTPIYEGDNLVATGVLMEAVSLEDNGEGISFCVFVYNAQPGISIDYKTGASWLSTENPPEDSTGDQTIPEGEIGTFVLNNNTQKFHKETCHHAESIAPHNKGVFTGPREELILDGYDPCKVCKP